MFVLIHTNPTVLYENPHASIRAMDRFNVGPLHHRKSIASRADMRAIGSLLRSSSDIVSYCAHATPWPTVRLYENGGSIRMAEKFPSGKPLISGNCVASYPMVFLNPCGVHFDPLGT